MHTDYHEQYANTNSITAQTCFLLQNVKEAFSGFQNLFFCFPEWLLCFKGTGLVCASC